MRTRIDRGLISLGLSSLFAILWSCGGGVTDVVKIPPPPPIEEVLSISSLLPLDGSQILSSFKDYPKAVVKLGATATSTKSGALSNLVYSVDGTKLSSNEVTVLVGSHQACVVATAPTGMSTSKCWKFSVPPANFVGKIYMAGTTSCPANVLITADYTKADSTFLKSDCTFVLSSKYALLDTAVIETRDPNGTMINFVGHIPKKYFGTLNIVGVPTVWNISVGIFKDKKVAIDLESAYRISGDGNTSFYYRAGDQNGWLYQVGSFISPTNTAFCRNLSTQDIPPSDSVTFWSLMKTFQENYIGKTIFVPSNQAGVCEEGLGSRGVKLINAVNERGKPNGGSEGYGKRDFVRGIINGYSKYIQNSCFTIDSCVWHEMTHVVGHGHTCSWKTNMGTNCRDELLSNTPTENDVAYIQLMMAVAETERKLNTRFSLGQAHQGERLKKVLKEEFVYIIEPF